MHHILLMLTIREPPSRSIRKRCQARRLFLRRAEMDEPLPDGGMVRKLWIGETDAYRDHLLRLDRASRNRRFSGAVSGEFIARHAATANGLGVVVHGFFIDGVLRGAAELRPFGPMFAREGEAAFS